MSKNKRGVSRPGVGHFPLSPTGYFLSLAKEELFRAPARVTFLCLRRVTFFSWRKRSCSAPRRGALSSFCLRRVTFFSWRKKVTKERHLRKGGFRFPPFLKNPIPLKRPKREGCGPPSLETPTCGWAIIKSRLCLFAAKVGGGLWPPLQYAFALKCRSIRLYRG